MEDTIKTLAQELFAKLSVDGKIEVSTADNEIYNLFLDSKENALLIGKHGNTLSSIESILSLMLAQKTGEFKRIIVEVGGYRKEREEYLKDLTERLSGEVVASGVEKRISGLKPWERRLVHMYLADRDDIQTESVGEDPERVLIIRKK